MRGLDDLLVWEQKARDAGFDPFQQLSLLSIVTYMIFKQEAEEELGKSLTDEEALQYFFDETAAVVKAADTQEP